MQASGGQDQLSDSVKPLLEAVFALARKWHARADAPDAGPAPGSSLRADDDAAHPYEISHAVHGALVGAVDNLDALRALVADAHVVHARAPFTLLRAALENSAAAVWLLGLSSREDRLLRRLRLQWADSVPWAWHQSRTAWMSPRSRHSLKSSETVRGWPGCAAAAILPNAGRRSERILEVVEGSSYSRTPSAGRKPPVTSPARTSSPASAPCPGSMQCRRLSKDGRRRQRGRGEQTSGLPPRFHNAATL